MKVLRALVGALALAALAAAGVRGQDAPEAYWGAAAAREVARVGSVRVLEVEGPAIAGQREFYRPVPPLRIRHRWLLVQDSTAGVVFAAASGVKTGLDRYEGDLHLKALAGVAAIEVRALVFDVWGTPSAYLSATVLDERRAGESWEIHPRWREDAGSAPAHRTSITWIHRVMFDDESVVEADLGAVEAAWSHVTGSDFRALAEESIERADAL